MEVINHNIALKEMILKCNVGSVNYLSSKIQNKFISLLRNKV